MRNHIRRSLRALLATVVLFGTVTVGASALGTDVAFAQPLERRPLGGPRLRWGLEAGAGGDWGTPRGPAIGVFGQLGLQWNDYFAIFYQPALLAHSLGTSDDADLFLAWGNLAMADFTIQMFQIGIGGGVDVGKFASCTDNDCVTGSRTVDPALGGRVAVILQLRGLPGRVGIPFAFHVHSTFLDNDQRLTALLLTIGLEGY